MNFYSIWYKSSIYFRRYTIFFIGFLILWFLVVFIILISWFSILINIPSFIKLSEKLSVPRMILKFLLAFIKFFLKLFNIVSLLLHVISQFLILSLLLQFFLFVLSSFLAIFNQLVKSSFSSYFLMWR